MDDPRDVQISRRNTTSKSSASSCSAFAMETKRKKIRESTFFQQNEESNIQGKLDFELRMRDGAYKLLLACSKREQVLNASKSLLVSNARIRAYLAQLEEKKVEQEQGLVGAAWSLADPMSDSRLPCPGKVAISGLRIPLMWKDSDHFNNRGSSRRVAVFCVMKIGFEVFDTDMVVVDRSATDVCFEGVTIFNEAVPQFELKVELWSCAVEDDSAVIANTPKKLAKKLRNSMGKASGKKCCPLLDSTDPDSFLHSHPIPPGTRYSLLAYTTLCLSEAEDTFQSHSLVVLQDADWSSWLPLYGNLCCRLVAQPHCMTQAVMSGYLTQQQSVEGLLRCCSLYCVLSAGYLACYFTPEEITAKLQPSQRIPVNRSTRIRVTEKDASGRRAHALTVINPASGGPQTLFTAECREDLEDWVSAFHQHFFDQSQWLHCCDRLMEMEVETVPKQTLFLSKQADCVYNDLSINSPGKFESITDIIHSQIEKSDGRFLIGQEDEERGAPDWSSLFDGSRSVVVQKNVLSPGNSSAPFSSPAPSAGSAPGSAKKRRAPPPPPAGSPAPVVRPARPPLPAPVRPPPPCPPPSLRTSEKENAGALAPPQRAAPRSKTGRPSLDAKFSAIIQQLQRNQPGGGGGGGGAPLSRRNAPLGLLDVPPHGTAHQDRPRHAPAPGAEDGRPGPLAAGLGFGPVPAPRSKARKSFREKMNPKAW